MLARKMLSKDEEASTPDAEVTREDQDKINAFSRLHNLEKKHEGKLEQKQKEKEDLDEISTELELADEDELVPYRIGDAFMAVPLPEAQALLEESSREIEGEVSKLEEMLAEVREEMEGLKVQLYARFGRSINLET